MLCVGGVQIQTPFIWDVKVGFPSIERFVYSMAMFFGGLLKVSTSTSFNGQRTIPPQAANNNALLCARAFEHISTSFFHCHCVNSPNGKNILSIWIDNHGSQFKKRVKWPYRWWLVPSQIPVVLWGFRNNQIRWSLILNFLSNIQNRRLLFKNQRTTSHWFELSYVAFQFSHLCLVFFLYLFQWIWITIKG